MEKQYLNVLKNMITPKDFSNLTNQLLHDINGKYPRINVVKALKIVEFNMATILVIGVELAKDEKQDIKKMIDWYNICPPSYLVKTNYKKFMEKYKYYIKLVKEKVEADSKKNEK